ncbi:M23 family metallopeptidase [Flavobacterium pectinovorum]|uniref:M23 family metallopeptidase n=1 Tax=Flavobacterium pectinovorum TaxID=29533 RepID=A0A502EVL4_9FLAO|nr:M23 family metallopeptidase [Flavobacterium pectinovorum]TPG41965.1 M23 family metallopeptidase [Flavobacterium pectinovorum]
MTHIDSTFTPRKNTIAMSKNAIHNFNLSIKNSADIKSSEQLTEAIIKELAKVSKEMSQQKDIVEIWQEQQTLNTTAIANNSSTSIEEGAVNTVAEKSEKQLLSDSITSSVSEGIIANDIVSTGEGINGTLKQVGITSSVSETTTSSASIGEGVADTTGGTITSSPASVNTTSPTLGAGNSALNFSNSTTTQAYANVVAQQTLKVPQALQANSGEPTIEAVIAEIKKKLTQAINEKDFAAIAYWTSISKAFDEEAKVQDFDGKPNNILFTEMYAMLKQSNQIPIISQNFNWDVVRKKMVESIDNNILKGKISQAGKSRWEIIKNQLNNDTVNVANLFERYNELFLLLKEVEGLDKLPDTITITTKTKIYPNLTANLYADIGKEAVYVFLKEVSNNEITGRAVKKGAVKIKNTDATSFIVGESLEFILDEALIKPHNEYKKEDINWIIYNTKKKNDKGTVFVNEGTSFSYNFDTAGTYKVEAYGGNPGSNNSKTIESSAFVKLEIIAQEIVITSSGITKDGLTRTSTKEKTFKVALKNHKVQSLNPLKLYYQVESKTANKVNIISEERELDSTGIVKFPIPNLGEYCIKVRSKDQYALNLDYKFNAIKNEVTSIGQVNKIANNHIFLVGDPKNNLILEVKSFRINPATDEEKEDVKWIIYDANNKPYLPPGSVVMTDNNNPKKMHLHKWSYFDVPFPKKEGNYTVEAYSDTTQGGKAKSVFNIEITRPQVTEAYWASGGGSKKQASGFEGESNWVKANIPYYNNQTVRVYFYLNKVKTKYYCDVKTNENGAIFQEIKFDSNFRKLIGFQSRNNAKIGFKLLGIQNGKPYPFKTPTTYESDTLVSVTTEVKILDAYFMYDGRRVTSQDEIPFNEKGTTITIVAKTQNRIGKEIVLTAHKVGEKPIYTKAATVNSEGVAIATFLLRNLDKKLKKGTVNKYYVGIEAYSTKHLTNKMINMVVGAGGKKKNMANLTWGSKVTKEFREKVIEICEDLWPENTVEMANGLMAVMYRETNGTFAANQMAGYKRLISRDQMTAKYFENNNEKTGEKGSRAVGLIQFTQVALVSMKEFKDGEGFDKLHKLKLEYANMTEVDQLEKVRKYFKNVVRLPRTPEDIYVAVFSPDFVGKKDTDTLYKKGTSDYKANPGLDKDDNGIQKKELIVKYYASLKEGNKSDNIASVNVKDDKKKKTDLKWRNPLDIMELRGWYTETQWTPGKSDWHGRTGGKHDGLDLYAPVKTKAYACIDGIIRDPYESGTYGNTVTIEGIYNGQTYFFFYAHLNEAVKFKDGDSVKAGDSIGETGKTGNARSLTAKQTHLHFEIKSEKTRTGNKVDPNIITELTFNKTPDKNTQK